MLNKIVDLRQELFFESTLVSMQAKNSILSLRPKWTAYHGTDYHDNSDQKEQLKRILQYSVIYQPNFNNPLKLFFFLNTLRRVCLSYDLLQLKQHLAVC